MSWYQTASLERLIIVFQRLLVQNGHGLRRALNSTAGFTRGYAISDEHRNLNM